MSTGSGSLAVGRDAQIHFPNGLVGFPQCRDCFLEDAGEGSLILWLRSTTDRQMCFPVLNPRVFLPNYQPTLSAVDYRELRIAGDSPLLAVFCILSIPADVSQMTANLRAPVVINPAERVGKQVVLQDNELSLKHPMFRELKAYQMVQTPEAALDPGPVVLERLSGLSQPAPLKPRE